MVRPPDLAIVYFSPFAEQLTGYTATDIQGKSFLEVLVPEADRSRFVVSQRSALEGTPQRGSNAKFVVGTAPPGWYCGMSAACRTTMALRHY